MCCRPMSLWYANLEDDDDDKDGDDDEYFEASCMLRNQTLHIML